MSCRRKTFLIYMVIILLQIIVILYWANEKSNFFIDELYSKGYASSFTGEGDTAQYITVSSEWKLNEWINNTSLKKYLVVSDEEQIFRLPFSEAVKKLLIGRNYFGLLNIAESMAGYSIVSMRPGILLNMFIFIIVELALLIFMRKIKMDVRSRYLALIMFGFSGYIISCVEYIRFYIIVIMYLIWLINLYYCVWSNNCFKKIIPAEIGILILTYLAYKNSELTLIFFGAISFCFTIALIITKKRKQFVSYVAVGICSSIYILAKTDYVNTLFHPAKYSAVNNAAVGASVRISKASLGVIKSNLYWLMELIEHSYFGHYLVILVAAISLTAYSLWMLSRKRDDSLQKKLVTVRRDMMITMAVWVGLLVLFSYRSMGITVCVIVICILFVRLVLELIGDRINLRKVRLSPESGFICVLLGTAAIYTLVATMADFKVWRYYCFAFVLIIIVFWYIWDRILTKFVPQEMVCGWYVILLASVSLSTFIPFRTRNIEYIYEDDRNFKYAVEQYKEMDTILVVYENKAYEIFSRHETYDCIYQMSENSNIYVVYIEKYLYDEANFTNEFIFWGHKDMDLSAILDNLSEHGYEIESLGTNHVSQAYMCRMH